MAGNGGKWREMAGNWPGVSFIDGRFVDALVVQVAPEEHPRFEMVIQRHRTGRYLNKNKMGIFGHFGVIFMSFWSLFATLLAIIFILLDPLQNFLQIVSF